MTLRRRTLARLTLARIRLARITLARIALARITLARRTLADPRIARPLTLIRAALHPPAGTGRIALALGLGALCHALFAAGVLAMVAAMFFGLSESLGTVPWPLAGLANAALIVQFPLAHSLLLTGPGERLMARMIPGPHGQTIATTTYAIAIRKHHRLTLPSASTCDGPQAREWG